MGTTQPAPPPYSVHFNRFKLWNYFKHALILKWRIRIGKEGSKKAPRRLNYLSSHTQQSWKERKSVVGGKLHVAAMIAEGKNKTEANSLIAALFASNGLKEHFWKCAFWKFSSLSEKDSGTAWESSARVLLGKLCLLVQFFKLKSHCCNLQQAFSVIIFEKLLDKHNILCLIYWMTHKPAGLLKHIFSTDPVKNPSWSTTSTQT